MAQVKRPWMPLYVDDYRRDTNGLSTLEHGAYLLLIMEYWAQGKLPNDERKLAAICRLNDKEWKKVLAGIRPLFREDWTHKRVESEIARTTKVSDSRSTAASERWSKAANGHANGHANASAKGGANDDPNGHASEMLLQPRYTRDASDITHQKANDHQSTSLPNGMTTNQIFQKLLEAAGGHVERGGKAEFVGPVMDLIAMGCLLEEHILPVVREKVPGLSSPLKNWGARWLRDEILARKGSGPAIPTGPKEPTFDLVGGFVWPHSSIRQSVQTWLDGKGWALPNRREGDIREIPDDALPAALKGRQGIVTRAEFVPAEISL